MKLFLISICAVFYFILICNPFSFCQLDDLNMDDDESDNDDDEFFNEDYTGASNTADDSRRCNGEVCPHCY